MHLVAPDRRPRRPPPRPVGSPYCRTLQAASCFAISPHSSRRRRAARPGGRLARRRGTESRRARSRNPGTLDNRRRHPRTRRRARRSTGRSGPCPTSRRREPTTSSATVRKWRRRAQSRAPRRSHPTPAQFSPKDWQVDIPDFSLTGSTSVDQSDEIVGFAGPGPARTRPAGAAKEAREVRTCTWASFSCCKAASLEMSIRLTS